MWHHCWEKSITFDSCSFKIVYTLEIQFSTYFIIFQNKVIPISFKQLKRSSEGATKINLKHITLRLFPTFFLIRESNHLTFIQFKFCVL